MREGRREEVKEREGGRQGMKEGGREGFWKEKGGREEKIVLTTKAV